jgi:integrase/recombinase XerD
MKITVDDDVVLSRPLEGPLSAHIRAFAQGARQQGYARTSRHRRVLLAADFSRWLGQQAVTLCRVSSDHAACYLQSRARRLRVGQYDVTLLRQFMAFLRAERPLRTLCQASSTALRSGPIAPLSGVNTGRAERGKS